MVPLLCFRLTNGKSRYLGKNNYIQLEYWMDAKEQ